MITIVSPKFSPFEDGLSQYTKNFYLELIKREKVTVLTSKKVEIIDKFMDNPSIYPLITKWNTYQILSGIMKASEESEGIVLFQYVPFMYSAKGGINFYLPLAILLLRVFTRKKLQVMFHELYYPFQWRLKALLMHYSHRLIMWLISNFVHKIYTSTERFSLEIRKYCSKNDIVTLVVGSNIEFDNSLKKDDYRKNDSFFTLTTFGTLHPSKDILPIINIIPKVIKLLGADQFKIVFVGVSESEIINYIGEEKWKDVCRYIEATGFVTNDKVSQLLFESDLTIFYFSDGISTRRGSAMAALQHGKMLVTTRGMSTSHEFDGLDFVIMLSSSPREFEAGLIKFLEPLSKDKIIQSEEIKSFYKSNFEWEVIIDSYLKYQ